MNITISPIDDELEDSFPEYSTKESRIEYKCIISSNEGVMGFYIDSLLASLMKSLIENKNQTEVLYGAQIQVLQETIKFINQK